MRIQVLMIPVSAAQEKKWRSLSHSSSFSLGTMNRTGSKKKRMRTNNKPLTLGPHTDYKPTRSVTGTVGFDEQILIIVITYHEYWSCSGLNYAKKGSSLWEQEKHAFQFNIAAWTRNTTATRKTQLNIYEQMNELIEKNYWNLSVQNNELLCRIHAALSRTMDNGTRRMMNRTFESWRRFLDFVLLVLLLLLLRHLENPTLTTTTTTTIYRKNNMKTRWRWSEQKTKR